MMRIGCLGVWRRLVVVFLVCAAFSAIGCQARLQGGVPPSMQGAPIPTELSELLEKTAREGERNWVLNLDTMALAALRLGDRELAKRSLDEAILQIEIIYGDSDQARKARSLWHEEGEKIFKGDPYERSMTYFYRGVLYMQDGEWDNARACFRSAVLQDAFAEEDQHRGDWTLFDYLIGVCEVQLGDEDAAHEAFARAGASYAGLRKNYSGLSGRRQARLDFRGGLPEFDHDANVLVLTQMGQAPIKKAAGRYGEYLRYDAGGGPAVTPFVDVNGQEVGAARTVDSVYFQAVTRGGRELDRIQEGKAKFKETTESVGQAGMIGGGIMTVEGLKHDNRDLKYVGLGALTLGFLSYGVSSMTKPKADTRQWRSLPDSLGVFSGTIPAGRQPIGVRYGVRGRNVSSISSVVTVNVPEPGKGLVVLMAFPPPQPVLVSEQGRSLWVEDRK